MKEQPVLWAKLLDEFGAPLAADPGVGPNLLANHFNLSWFDELNGPGYGTLQMPLSETDAVDELTLGRLVRTYVGEVEGMCWRIEGQPKIVDVSPDEEFGQVMEVRGRGWAAILEDAIVYPPIPVGETTTDLTSPFLGPDRIFSFASPDYPGQSPLIDWPLTQSGYDYETLQPFRYEHVETTEGVWENLPAPVGFPWPNSEVYPNITNPIENKAYWIWPTVDPMVEGWAFFIGDWVYPDTTRAVTITTTADNLFTFFMDGTPILGESVDTAVWQGWKEVTTKVLTERKYRMACAVRNTPGPGINPGGWLMAATYNDDAGVIEDWAFTTNGAWRGIYSPDTWPGWSAGQILLRLVDEYNNRAASALAIGLGFDGVNGSDGEPWTVTIDGVPTSQIPWFSVSHGSSYLEVLDKLHQDGWVNWRMDCGLLTLRMWSYDSAPFDSGATYTAGTNIVSLERSGDQQYANVLLVSYEGGFVEVKDDAAIALYGRVEDVLQSDATDATEATRIGGHELEHRARDVEGGAIVIEIEPVDADGLDTPYLDAVHVGHGVTIPSPGGGTALVRVMSIAARQDDLGNPTFILELNKRWPVQERDTSRLLRSIGGKSLGQAGTRGKVS